MHTDPTSYPHPPITVKTLFAEISKVEELEDGTVNVFGIASTESRDHDEELIRSAAVKAALPEWLTFGNIREMHQPIAAGTAIEAHVDDEGVTHLGAHIVDPSSVKKVKAGVLKGFSLGGRVTKRNAKDKSIIEGLRITEISLVDRPANPDALITLVKFDSAGRRKNVAKTAATDDVETDDIAKGMFDVSQLASLIQSLAYVQSNAAYEAGSEGDGSTMPGRLKSSIQSLVDCLRDMVDEETRELLGGMVDVVAMAKAIDTADLNKVGRKFSATTTKMLGDVHAAMKDCCDKLDKLGYMKADNPEDDDAMNDSEKAANDAAIDARISKAISAAVEPLNKAQTDLKKSFDDAVAENATLKAELDKAKGEAVAAKALAQEIADAAVAKGYVKPIAKNEDGNQSSTDEVAKAAAAKKPTDVQAELRSTFAKPLSPIRGTALAR